MAVAPPAPAPWAGVRTLSSLSSPWYFNAIPEAQAAQFAGSWKSAFDPQGIGGKYGLRTAEKRTVPGNHYRQKYPYSCYAHDCCYWGGPVWPFESAKALTGAANVLQNPKLASVVEGAASGLTRSSLWMMLANYTAMHGDQWTVTNFTDGSRADYQELNRSGYFLSGLGLEQSQGTAGHAMWIAEAGCADDATWTDNPSGGYLYEHSTYMDIVLQVRAIQLNFGLHFDCILELPDTLTDIGDIICAGGGRAGAQGGWAQADAAGAAAAAE
jgi:hypothetical protein